MNTATAAQAEPKTDEEYRAEFYRILGDIRREGEEIDAIQARTAVLRQENLAALDRLDALMDRVARSH